jgi:hypothetical protein
MPTGNWRISRANGIDVFLFFSAHKSAQTVCVSLYLGTAMGQSGSFELRHQADRLY